MRVIRVIALATALLVVGGTASALATSWGSYSLPQPIWFSGATSWNNQVVQVGGLGFPGNKYQPLVAAFEFNPFGGSTQNLHPLPSARFGDAVVTGQDGFVYAFGGLNASNAVLGSAVRTDPTLPTNIWAARAPLPIPRVALSAAVASNGLIYTIGGDRAVSGGKLAPSPVVEIYNPTANTWSAGPALPQALDDTAAATSGTHIFVFGGYSAATGPSAAAYSLDTSAVSAQWVRIPNMPSAADLPGAATDPTDADGRIYVAGGAIGQAGLRRVDVYDPAQNLWSCIEPMPEARIGGAAASIFGNSSQQLVLSGGLTGNVVQDAAYFKPTGLDTSDVTPPVVTSPPVPRIVSGVQASKSGTTTRFETALGWSRSDAQTDILADNLERNTSGGWIAVSTPWATLDPGYIFWASNNHLQYGVKPTDCNNNAVAAVDPGPAFSTRVYSESALHYTGSWPSYLFSSAQGGRYRASAQTGAVASYKFTGARDIAWLAVKGPGRGVAYVAINGVRVATVNLYSKTVEPREVVWHRSFESFTNGTLTIQVAGTAGHPSVDVDSLFAIAQPIGPLPAATPRALSHSNPGESAAVTAGHAPRVARP